MQRWRRLTREIAALLGDSGDTLFLTETEKLADWALGTVGGSEAVREAVRTWAMSKSGSAYSKECAAQYAAELAGWEHEFRHGLVFLGWSGVRGVWANLYVETVDWLATEPVRQRCQMIVLEGPASGLRLTKDLKLGLVRMIMRCSGTTPQMVLQSSEDERTEGRLNRPERLAGTLFSAWLEQQDSRICIVDTTASDAQKAHNRALRELRERPCTGWYGRQIGLDPAAMCTPDCPSAIERCPLASRRQQLVLGVCRNVSVVHEGLLGDRGYCLKCLRTGKTTDREKEECTGVH